MDVLLDPGEKLVVPVIRGRRFVVGERVSILVKETPLRRTMLSVVLPVFFTCVSFIVFFTGTGDVLLSGIMSLIVLGPYFSFIWFLKDTFSRTVSAR